MADTLPDQVTQYARSMTPAIDGVFAIIDASTNARFNGQLVPTVDTDIRMVGDTFYSTMPAGQPTRFHDLDLGAVEVRQSSLGPIQLIGTVS